LETLNKNASNLVSFQVLGYFKNLKTGVFPKGRILVGRSESCDLCVPEDSVSAVHAVIEIFDNKAVIYDMNSTNGTFVNGEKIIVKEISFGDKFSLGRVDIRILKYSSDNTLPPVLETLEPSSGKASPVAHKLNQISTKNLPELPQSVLTTNIPEIVYPLSSDPKAEFSEYIFEDKEEIYPIFKYDHLANSVEVIILYKDHIYSVDYLPEKNGNYFISGLLRGNSHVEFPYLNKTEKYEFISVNTGNIVVKNLPGFDLFIISDKKSKSISPISEVELAHNDIVRLSKNDLQIFVRNVSSPPKVAAAPILKRDPDFQKYLFTFLFFVLCLSVGLNVIELPEDEKEDELAPERLATILYKQPLTLSNTKAVEKTELAENKIQKAPDKPAVEKKVVEETKQDIKKPDVVETKVQNKKPDPGIATAQEKKIVKQGQNQFKPESSAAPKKENQVRPNELLKQAATSSFSNLKTSGHVEVYKSADFKSSISSLVAKGGSLTGLQNKGLSGASGSLSGATSSLGAGTGNLKTAEISTNQGSLVGATSGAISNSKGAEGLSSKRAVYTAGIPSETVVLGSMDPDIIRKILLDHLPQFRYCYQKELERLGSEVSGVVKLNFIIGASGYVSQAGVDGSSPLPVDVKKCVVGVLRGISFPEPNGGGTVEVRQPMNFYPKKI